MTDAQLTVAIVHDVFPTTDDHPRLRHQLQRARACGAELAVLPELPLDRWAPATPELADDDAEPPGGPRFRAMADAAAAAGIGLLGGAIVRDPASGRRHNTAFVFGAAGELLGSFMKTHLPQEEGFWEASHYRAGDQPPTVIDGLPLRLGVQICSDANRPQGTHLLRSLGAELVLVPRATPTASYERWKLVLRANAVTAALYVISVNRPGPEAGVPIGGPSIVIAPDGEVLTEGSEALQLVTLQRSRVAAAWRGYPGYLAERSELYLRGWQGVRTDPASSVFDVQSGVHDREHLLRILGRK